MVGVSKMVGGKKVSKKPSDIRGFLFKLFRNYTFLSASISALIRSTSVTLAVSAASHLL